MLLAKYLIAMLCGEMDLQFENLHVDPQAHNFIERNDPHHRSLQSSWSGPLLVIKKLLVSRQIILLPTPLANIKAP